MTPNKRIFLNIITTYGRSVFSLICGILTGRWSLLTLGKINLGLYGVIGGTTAFIYFFNTLMSTAVSRYYAYSIGETMTCKEVGLQKCIQWFNTALLLHTIIPLVLMIIGYPIGVFAIKQWLTIPHDKIYVCIWIFRFSCITCLITMLMVPYYAMYQAKQLIAELTIYQLISNISHVCVLFYMLKHPAEWLLKYSLATCIYSLIPSVLIWVHAVIMFPECKFNFRYIFNLQRIKLIFQFAGWQFYGCLGTLLRNQGIAILINKCFGPSINASYAIANNLAGHTQTLSASLSGAFSPAITTACGAKDLDRMRYLSYMTCKFGTLLILIFALPLMLELDNVLILWLKDPPEYINSLCFAILLMLILDRISYGHMLAVNAVGKIALYQAVMGSFIIITLPIAWLFIQIGLKIYSIVYALILTMFIVSIGRVWFARKLTGLSMKYWVIKIIFPLMTISIISIGLGWLPHYWMTQNFLRIIITTLIVNLTLLTLTWRFLLSKDEKCWIKKKCMIIIKK